MAHVVCIGTAVIDTVFAVERLPLAPGKNFARSVVQVGGGMAANGAVTVAALGGEASFFGSVGDDAVGEQIAREFVAWGVEVSGLRRVAGHPSPMATVLVDPAGERQLVGHLDPALFADADGLPLERIAGADAVLCDLRWEPAVMPALAEAQACGVPGVVDFDVARHGDVRAVLDVASHIAFSREALATLAGTAEVEAGLLRLAARTEAWLGVTCGADGAYWLEGDTLHHVPAFEVRVVDTLAAGDVFHGALALALAEGQPIGRAVRFASAAAALKCTRFGGRAGIPRRAEVERLLGAGA